MIWVAVILGVIVLLQVIYTGYIRWDVEMGFLGQDAVLARHGSTVTELNKKIDKLESENGQLSQRIWKTESELDSLKQLCRSIERAEREARLERQEK